MAFNETLELGATANDGKGKGLRTNMLKLLENDNYLKAQTETFLQNGVKTYQTYADLPDPSALPDNVPAKIANDPTATNNGYYSVVGGAWVKDADLYENIIDNANTSKGVSGKAVFDHTATIKKETFEDISLPLEIYEYQKENYLNSAGTGVGGHPDYRIYKFRVKEGRKIKIKGQVTTLNSSFGAFGFYADTTVGSYVGGIETLPLGTTDYDVILTVPATAKYLFLTQSISNDLGFLISEFVAAKELNDKPVYNKNIFKNYRFESTLGETPADNDTTIPTSFNSSISNATVLGYQKSNCPTGMPAFKYSLGNSPASSSYALFGQIINDPSLIDKLKNKEVCFSFWIKHDIALANINLFRIYDGVNNNSFSLKTDGQKLGKWYKVCFYFTIPTITTSIDLRAYPALVTGTAQVELSSYSLKVVEPADLDYGFELNAEWESYRNNVLNNKIGLQLPEEITIVEGNRLEIFKHAIVNAINPDNYFLNINLVSGTAKGNFYDRLYVYDCAVSDTNMELEFTLQDDALNYIDRKTVLIKPIVKGANPGSTFNVLIIGDSFTQTPTYPNELYRRLHDSGGAPAGDNLSNITFIGTNALGDVPREGYSGQTWAFFLSSSSPFYNGGTGQIDFANYVTVNGYGSIDAVIILLGTNSTSSDAEVSSFLDKLVAYNPSIKGLVTGKILPAPFGGAGSVGLAAGQTFYGGFKNTFIYNRRMEALIKNSYAANFRFVDLLPSFDVINNMPHTLVNANFRNSTDQERQGTDNVHPNSNGYLQIADIFYSAFHDYIL